jgi:lipid A 3-O-deacylase
MNTHRLLAAAAAVAATMSFQLHAMDLRPQGVFVVAGAAPHSTNCLAVGAIWPWAWRKQAAGGEFSAITEAYVSYWKADAVGGGRHSLVQIGLVPLLRYRPGQGRSPWFAEAGIGISTMTRLYTTPDKQFSTRFNFVDTIGAGRNFGAQGQHELGLRIVHMSNAGIKHPNPGENFLQLRYAVKF